MDEAQVEVRCPGCGARYWVEREQLGTVAECGECDREFTLKTGQPGTAATEKVQMAFDGDGQRANVTISSFMRERGVSGGVSLEDSAEGVAAQQVLEADSGRKYAVGNVVAKGGMGAILNCRDLNIRRNVAMKVMLNPEQVEEPQVLRFIEEAQVTGQLEHPGIVPVYELGVDAGENVFYTMKFVRGRTLKDILKGVADCDAAMVSAFPLVRLLSIFLRVCEAMAYAHHKQVIHRDLKPENIMIGDFGEVYVMDWGLAKVIGRGPSEGDTRHSQERSDGDGGAKVLRKDEGGEEDTQSAGVAGASRARARDQAGDREDPSDPSAGAAAPTSPPAPQVGIDYARDDFDDEAVNTLDGAVMGTPQYMAPEQARGKVSELDQRADVYALGAILYEILSLQRAVVGKTVMALLMKVSTGELVPLPTDADPAARPHCPNGRIPDSLAAVAMKALALKPDNRYATVQKLQTEIEAYHGGFATAAEEAGLLRQLGLLIKRHKAEFGLAVSAVIILAAVVAGFVMKVNTEKNVALVARNEAVTAQAAEARQRREAEVAREAAEEARAAEAKRSEELEYENYVNLIAVADARVRELAFDKAEELLWATPKHLRHWEWGYLMRQCHQDLLTIRGDWGRVFSVRFSPDGKLLATGTEDGIARIWDATTGRLVKELVGHPHRINAVAFSPDGQLLLTGGNASRAKIWSVETGTELASIKCNLEVRAVAFLPNGKRFVTAGGDFCVTLWDTETGAAVRTLRGHEKAILSLSVSPDGRFLASGSQDYTVRIWDAEAGSLVRLIDLRTSLFPANYPYALAFTPDGKRIAIGDAANQIQFWDVEGKGGPTLLTKAEVNTGDSIAFSPRISLFATGHIRDNHVRIWQLSNGRELKTFAGHGARVNSVTFSPDGRRLASGSGDGSVKLWSVLTDGETALLRHPGMQWASWSADGRRIATISRDTVRIWDATAEVQLREFSVSAEGPAFRSIAISPDGTRAVLKGAGHGADVCDLEAAKITLSLERGVGKLTSVAFSPSSNQVATGTTDRLVTIWDANTGEMLHKLSGLRSAVYALTYSPDGRVLAGGSWRGDVKLWRVDTGEEMMDLEGHAGAVNIAAFSPDGSLIATGSQDRSARIWSVRTGRLLRTLRGHGDGLLSLDFSPDGRRVVTGGSDFVAKIWDAESGRELLTLPQVQSARVVSFSTDTRRLFTGLYLKGLQISRAYDWTLTREQIAQQRLERYREFMAAGERREP